MFWSRSGSKSILEPERVKNSIEKIGIGFLFAPIFHPAMRFAAPVRAKLGRKTIFNLLGPLTNPAGARHILLGVADAKLVPTFAEVLRQNGAEHALVAHGAGLDELTTAGENFVFELRRGEIAERKINLSELGFEKTDAEKFAGRRRGGERGNLPENFGGRKFGEIGNRDFERGRGDFCGGRRGRFGERNRGSAGVDRVRRGGGKTRKTGRIFESGVKFNLKLIFQNE